jgi:GNAT superfamily N-acetyltransferase
MDCPAALIPLMDSRASSPASSTVADIQLRRCRNPALIEHLLSEHYFDAPICYFPRSLIRTLARGWFATSAEIYLITAEMQGQCAGFLFGHTLGPGLWRRFAREQWRRHFFALLWVAVTMRVLRPLRKRLRPRCASPLAHGPAAQVRALDLPQLDHPFRWSPHRPDLGCTELIFVREEFRGHGLAPRLYRFLAEEMRCRGVRIIEGHIDAYNYASVRANLKSGWEIFQTTGNGLYKRYSL